MTRTPEEVAAAARSLVGSPYVHQGRQPGHGVDCIGLAVCIGRLLGLCTPDFDITGYGPDPNDGMLLRLLEAHLQVLDEPRVGALLAMRWFQEPQHVGVVVDSAYSGELNLVHADGRVGKCVEHRIDEKWRNRVVCVFAFPQVDYGTGEIGGVLSGILRADAQTPVTPTPQEAVQPSWLQRAMQEVRDPSCGGCRKVREALGIPMGSGKRDV